MAAKNQGLFLGLDGFGRLCAGWGIWANGGGGGGEGSGKPITGGE